MDDVRDQCLRSVLHYAYAMPRARKLVNLLLDYGASEFTMDKVSLFVLTLFIFFHHYVIIREWLAGLIIGIVTRIVKYRMSACFYIPHL